MRGTIRKLVRKVASVAASAVTPRHSEIRDQDLEYLLWQVNLYREIAHLPGHVAEIGVASGRNSVLFGKLIKLHGEESTRHYFGFDTFDGYVDRDLTRDGHLSADSWKEYTFSGVSQRLEDNDLTDVCTLIQGDAVKSVPEFLSATAGPKLQAGKGRFSLCYIDCNAYEPAISSLKAFLPHMVPNGIFCIDEKLQGSETEALLTFARENGLDVQKMAGRNVPAIVRLPAHGKVID